MLIAGKIKPYYKECQYCGKLLPKPLHRIPYCNYVCKRKGAIQNKRNKCKRGWNLRTDTEKVGKWVLPKWRWKRPYDEISAIFFALGVKHPCFEDAVDYKVILGEHPSLGKIYVELRSRVWSKDKDKRYHLEWVQCLASPSVRYAFARWEVYTRCLYQTREALLNAETGAVDKDFIPTKDGKCGCRGCLMGQLLTKLQLEDKFNFVYKGHWYDTSKWKEAPFDKEEGYNF